MMNISLFVGEILIFSAAKTPSQWRVLNFDVCPTALQKRRRVGFVGW
jgi:hypothetical protein